MYVCVYIYIYIRHWDVFSFSSLQGTCLCYPTKSTRTISEYVCMYVDMSVCIYMCVCMYVTTSNPFKANQRVPFISQVPVRTCAYVHTCIHTYMHTCIHACIQGGSSACTYKYMYLCTYIRTFIHAYHTCSEDL